MKSKTRLDCEKAEEVFSGILATRHARLKNPKMLMVGVAGNPLTHNGKPGLDRPELFTNYDLTTLDFDKKWGPDIVGDITTPDLWVEDTDEFDLIHITQVIEHIPNLWDLPEALNQILSKDGYIIIDCPWGPKGPGYHAEPPSFGDYWRISKDGMRILFEKRFIIEMIIDTDANTSCLLRKKL